MMKVLAAVALLVVIGFSAIQLYDVQREAMDLRSKVDGLQKEASAINDDNKRIIDKIDYLGKADNLIKELKTKFNYRLPEEKTIIVAPKEKQN
ncbi:MAG: hypothetical protein PHG66_02110 [Candidatus Colwellbacteria bacterium]|nr:hypothetical protein [Candidatus Colwellbacteria bacterium]